MTKKQDKNVFDDEWDEPAPEPPVVKSPVTRNAPVTPESRDPTKMVGLQESTGGIVYVEHSGAESHDRRIDVDGQNYEHVSEDADGVWIYRQM